jgi:hypothetical protein
MREVMRLYRDASDKELYYRAIDRYYVLQGKRMVEMLSADTTPRRICSCDGKGKSGRYYEGREDGKSHDENR